MSVSYILNGVALTNPTSLATSRYTISKSGRTASGLMKFKTLANKRKFEFEYEVLPGDLYELLNSILFSGQDFFTLVYLENNISKTCVVYAGATQGDRFRTDGRWYWKNVKFALIEQ